MTRSDEQPRRTEPPIARDLERRAVELWGEARARRARESVALAAANILRLAIHLPDAEEEPGFYF